MILMHKLLETLVFFGSFIKYNMELVLWLELSMAEMVLWVWINIRNTGIVKIKFPFSHEIWFGNIV